MTRAQPRLVPVLLCKNEVSHRVSNALRTLPSFMAGEMTASFFKPANAFLLGPEMLHLISEQRKYVLFKELCILDHLRPTYEDVQFIYTTQTLVEYQLLSLPFDNIGHPLTPAQESVRLALFVFAQPIITLTKPSSAFTRSMARQLKESLLCTEMPSLWSPNFDLLLWVLFIAAHISDGQEEWTWVVTHISKLVRLLRLQALNQVEEILLGFYYPQDAFGRTLIAIWRDAQQTLETSGTYRTTTDSEVCS